MISRSASARSIAIDRRRQIGAALEAVRRLGAQAQPLARRAHRLRLEPRALEHDALSSASETSESAPPMTPPIACARSASAMTSMSSAERALLAVERLDRLAGPRAADDDRRAAKPRQIERVHRMPELEQHVVGDVDDVADRTDAARRQPRLHPVGRRADA